MTSWILQWGKRRQLLLSWSREGRWGRGVECDSKSNRAWPLCAICCFMTQEMHKGFADSCVRSLAAPPPFIFLLIHCSDLASLLASSWEPDAELMGDGYLACFFFILAQIIPEAFEESVRVDRQWKWEQDGPSGPLQPFWELNHR